MNTIHYTTKTYGVWNSDGYYKNDNIMRNRMDSGNDRENMDNERRERADPDDENSSINE